MLQEMLHWRQKYLIIQVYLLKKNLDLVLHLHTAEKIDLIIKTLAEESGISFDYTGDLTAIDINYSTESGIKYGSAGTNSTATGIDLDFSTFNITEGANNAEIVGLRIDMGRKLLVKSVMLLFLKMEM